MKEGTNKIRHFKPMKKNFRMKSVIPTIQRTSQKLNWSSVGFKKIKLPREKHKHLWRWYTNVKLAAVLYIFYIQLSALPVNNPRVCVFWRLTIHSYSSSKRCSAFHVRAGPSSPSSFPGWFCAGLWAPFVLCVTSDGYHCHLGRPH